MTPSVTDKDSINEAKANARRSHRSATVSQKFKSLFLGSSASINEDKDKDNTDLKRVHSTSSIFKKSSSSQTLNSSVNSTPSHADTVNTGSTGATLTNNVVQSQHHSPHMPSNASTSSTGVNKPVIPHVPNLPIPNRTLGRAPTNPANNHSLHVNTNLPPTPNGSNHIPTPKHRLPALPKQDEITNDIDSELDIPDDRVMKVVEVEHPKSSRVRSSTVSVGYNRNHDMHPQSQGNNKLHLPSLRHSKEDKDDMDESDDSTPIQPYEGEILSATGSQYTRPIAQPLSSNTNYATSKDPRFLQGLRHTESVNYSSTHLKHERDQSIKLNARMTLSEFGRCHEHDFTKFKTHPNKPTAGFFSWMKKKEAAVKGDKDDMQSSYAVIEKSVSLLPDKYSGNLMRVKNNPKNYIWNYDDEDEDDDYDEDDEEYDNTSDESDYDEESPKSAISTTPTSGKRRPKVGRKMSLASVHSSKSVRSRQSKITTKHYNSDDEYENEDDYVKDMEASDSDPEFPDQTATPTRKKFDHSSDQEADANDDDDDDDDADNDDDDDDDDDDDFDDEVDNMMIEPIIGKEQVFLINSMLNKIEHPEKFKAKLKEKDREGKVKLSLAQKYGHIEGVIGKGSYGTVCISSKVVNNTKIFFAIKQIKRKQGETLHHFGNRVTSEFMISSSLTHQAVINVYDLMVDPGSMIYSEIMEYIPCGDLFSLISVTHGLDIVECDCFFKQILNAITYLHSVGVSHNDLKVENLLLTRKGQLKIIDFGTSAVFKTAWENDVQMSLGACGSERYVAPEQYDKGREYDPRLGDVWSLGVIYLTMYYGKYAWEAAKLGDESFKKFLESRAVYDYNYKSTKKAHQFKCIKNGAYPPIDNISGGITHSWRVKGGQLDTNIRSNDEELINDSRRYVLYNIFNPDPTFRMRTYQIWQSEWIKNFRVCDAGRGYVSYDNYIEMALKSARDVETREKETDADREKDKDEKLERKESRKGYGFLTFGSNKA